MERQIGQIGGEAGEAGGIDLLDQQLIERAGEIGGEAQRLGRVGAEMELDEPGEQHQPPRRLDRRRHRLVLVERLEHAADPLVELGIADRDQPRQQQPAVRAAHERVLDRPRGAVVGDEHDARAPARSSRAPKRAISPAASASAKARCGGMVKTAGITCAA